MADDGIDIRIGVDPSKVIEGADDAASALEKIDDALGDVSKSGDKDLEKLEKSLKDIDQAALRTGDELDRNLGKGTKKAAREAGDGLQDFKKESNQIAKESATSFDGTAESIADVFRDLAANAFEGFGPAGAAAGIAIAAGIGLATEAFNKSQADAERLKDRINDLAAALIESGGDLNLGYVVDTLKNLATGSEEGTKSLKDLKAIADKAGLPFESLANAVAGNVPSFEDLLKAARDWKDEVASQKGGNYDAIYSGQIPAINDYIAALKDAQKVAEEAAEVQIIASQAGIGELEAKLGVQQQINQAYDDAAGNITPYINEESKLFDTAAYIKAMQEREQALTDYQTALATSGLDSNAKAFLATQGEEIAASMLQGYSSGDAKTKAELSRIWSEAGRKASGDASKEIDAGLKDDKTVKIDADTGLASEAIRTWNPGTKTIDILVQFKDKRTGQVIP